MTERTPDLATDRLAIFCSGRLSGVRWISLDQTGQPPAIVHSIGAVRLENPYTLATPADAPISVYYGEREGADSRKALAAVAELVRVLSGIPNVSVDHDAQMKELREQLLATVANAEELLQGRDTKIDHLEFRIEKIIRQAREWKGKTLRRDLYIESWKDENEKLAETAREQAAAASRWEDKSNRYRRGEKHANEMLSAADATTADLRELLRTTQESALDTIQKIVANLTPPEAEIADAAVVRPDLDVDTWFSADGDVPVVQIDTPRHAGRLRVNLNDGVIWDGDPEEDERPGKHAERLPHEEIGVVDPVTMTTTVKLPEGSTSKLAAEISDGILRYASLVRDRKDYVKPELLEEIVKLPEGLQPHLPSTLPDPLVANKLTAAILRPAEPTRLEMMLRSEIVDGVAKIRLSREEFQGHVDVTLDGKDLVEANVAAIDAIRDKDDRIVALKAARDVEEARANSAESQLITATNELEKVQETRAELEMALRNLRGEGTEDDPGAHGGTVPRYGMLDLWQAVSGSDSVGDFDDFYETSGYAEAWSQLLANVRTLVNLRDELRRLLLAAQIDHANASRTAHAHLDEAERLRGEASQKDAHISSLEGRLENLQRKNGDLAVDLHNEGVNYGAAQSALTVCEARLSESEAMRRKLDARLEEERGAYVAGTRAVSLLDEKNERLSQRGIALAVAVLGFIPTEAVNDARTVRDLAISYKAAASTTLE